MENNFPEDIWIRTYKGNNNLESIFTLIDGCVVDSNFNKGDIEKLKNGSRKVSLGSIEYRLIYEEDIRNIHGREVIWKIYTSHPEKYRFMRNQVFRGTP